MWPRPRVCSCGRRERATRAAGRPPDAWSLSCRVLMAPTAFQPHRHTRFLGALCFHWLFQAESSIYLVSRELKPCDFTVCWCYFGGNRWVPVGEEARVRLGQGGDPLVWQEHVLEHGYAQGGALRLIRGLGLGLSHLFCIS